MADVFGKIWALLDKRERRNAVLLFSMIMVMGMLEAIGVASIMPFISVITNPELIEKNSYLNAIYRAFDFTETDDFLIFMGFGVFVLVIGSLAFKALTYWAMVRFTQMRNFSLSKRLLGVYLHQPYAWFLNRHSTDLGKAIITEVLQVVNNALIPGVQLVASGVVALFLLLLVILVEPAVAIIAACIFGGAYSLIYLFVRNRLGHLGIVRGQANQDRYRVAHEALAGIKDIKIHGLENIYLAAFKEPAMKFSRSQTKNLVIGQLPRFLLEGLVFGGMLVLLLVLLIIGDGGLEEVLPLIALYAFAGARLIPAFQQVYKAMARLRYGKPALDELHADLKDSATSSENHEISMQSATAEKVRLNDSLVIRDAHFSYPGSKYAALNGLGLSIAANTTVALVGASGAGKTTAVDLMLGLLFAEQGEVIVDGMPITKKNVRSWQRNIGYVPQTIFLIDDTVAANIAFGVNETDIEKVERAARIADLHDFIVDELPDGYDTMIGERGVRLSGGQRQRIGIARALYHDPDVLVLDEATSALDNLTEKSVMDAVHALSQQKTIILIAHRLTTIQKCDEIYFMQNGELAARGTYEELLANEDFNSFASVHGKQEDRF